MDNQAPPFTWVRDRATLRALVEALAAAPWLALDSESNSMFVYRERVCLLQLNVGGALWLVDPIALAPGDDPQERARALEPLAAPLADPRLRIWIHGGEYDVACLKRDFDIALAGLFDTQQAASFLGWPRTGYATVVQELCGVSLSKAKRDHDWGRRPIDDEALRYALDDVLHLPTIGETLVRRIADADIEEELALANLGVAATEAHDNRFDPSKMWRLDGVAELDRERLALLTALYAWRDQKGRELDRPPGRLIANEPLMQLARKAPRDAPSLGRVRLRRSFVVSHGEELLALIDRALREPPGIPPKPRKPKRAPAERARHRALQAWRREEADRRQLPQQVVLPKQALDWLAREGADDLVACPQLGPGRIGRYGSILQRLCPRNSEVRESQ